MGALQKQDQDIRVISFRDQTTASSTLSPPNDNRDLGNEMDRKIHFVR